MFKFYSGVFLGNSNIGGWVVVDKLRKIRFADDATRDPEAPEKDTRLKFRPALSPLQMKMLELAGHAVPTTAEADKDKTTDDNTQHSDSDEDGASDDDRVCTLQC